MVAEIVEDSGERWGIVSRVARKLGVGEQALRNWVDQAEIEAGHRGELTSDERVRLKELEKENGELRRANDMAGSGGGRNVPCVGLPWCHVAESLARTAVEAALDSLQVGGRLLG